jgi:hypothetical protein
MRSWSRGLQEPSPLPHQGFQDLFHKWCLGSVRAHLGAPARPCARQLISENLDISMNIISRVQNWYQNASFCNVIETRHTYFSRRIRWRALERTGKPGRANRWRKKWAPEMSGIPQSVSGINLFLSDFTHLGFPVKSRDHHWIRFEKQYDGAQFHRLLVLSKLWFPEIGYYYWNKVRTHVWTSKRNKLITHDKTSQKTSRNTNSPRQKVRTKSDKQVWKSKSNKLIKRAKQSQNTSLKK